ncbi:MAG: L-histidine N(alpha)-methyltransferase [Acidobacteriota bacterium]|nr:L-histidine N(alpha)-methyltransferase [Acidobacteriota bacterium]
MDTSRVAIDIFVDEAGALATMADDVRRGLTSTPKRLSPKYFYDERGSWLFERITRLPEYYLTRAERSLLKDFAAEIASIVEPRELVELGPGSASKTHTLIEASRSSGRLERYLPVDVSSAMVEHLAERLLSQYDWLDLHAVVGDFERHLDRVPPGSHRLVAFLGSTIGNLEPDQTRAFLGHVHRMVGENGYFLLGTDLVKNRSVLEAAYNDDQGVTADFNRNVLRVINRHLDANFDPEAFDHVAFYNADREQVEIYLRSRSAQTVRLETLDLDVSFDRCERMCTEISRKYTRKSVEAMLAEAGLELTHWFTDPGKSFALSLSRRR